MPGVNLHRPYAPDPDQLARFPEVSDNTLNGLGDREKCQPDMGYRAPDPDDILHGDMQRWFSTACADDERFAAMAEWRAGIYDAPVPQVSGPTAQHTPEAWTASLNLFVDDGS